MKQSINEMNNYELSRWFALMEAVDLIDETSKTLKRDFDMLHLNPIAIKDFINNMSIKYEKDLEKDIQKTNEFNVLSIIEKVDNPELKRSVFD